MKEKLGRIVFLSPCGFMAEYDIVNIIMEDDKYYYYNDCMSRWCYTEKDTSDILFIPPGKRLNWKEIEKIAEERCNSETTKKLE